MENSWADRLTHTSDTIIHNDGRNVLLGDTFNLWIHDVNNIKNWDINSYTNLTKKEPFNTVSDYWKFANNFHKLGIRFNHFFFMRNDVEPTWEHVENRNGGVCSFKIELDKSSNVFTDLCNKMVCGELVEDPHDINGISLSPKNNWTIIKIWNKDKKNDLSKTLCKEIIEKYSELGIRYKVHTPEF
jgi:hypothetical protein